MIGKRLKEAMEEWDQEDVVRFVSEHKCYTPPDEERDILSEKINLLADLVDQKIDLVLKEGIIDFDTSMSVVHSFLDNMGFSHEDEKKVYTKLLVGTQYDELKEKGATSCFFSMCPHCNGYRVFQKESKCPKCGSKLERYLMDVCSLDVKKEGKKDTNDKN